MFGELYERTRKACEGVDTGAARRICSFSHWAPQGRRIFIESASHSLRFSYRSHPIQTSALNILMSLLKHLSPSLTRSSQTPQFHVPHFKKVITALLTCPPSERGGKKVVQGVPARGLDAELRDLFVSKWLNVYIDVRWFFLRDAEYDFCSPKGIYPRLTKFFDSDRFYRPLRPRQIHTFLRIFLRCWRGSSPFQQYRLT